MRSSSRREQFSRFSCTYSPILDNGRSMRNTMKGGWGLSRKEQMKKEPTQRLFQQSIPLTLSHHTWPPKIWQAAHSWVLIASYWYSRISSGWQSRLPRAERAPEVKQLPSKRSNKAELIKMEQWRRSFYGYYPTGANRRLRTMSMASNPATVGKICHL